MWQLLSEDGDHARPQTAQSKRELYGRTAADWRLLGQHEGRLGEGVFENKAMWWDDV